jgi:hypothetical protein
MPADVRVNVSNRQQPQEDALDIATHALMPVACPIAADTGPAHGGSTNMCPLKSIVLELMATDFISRSNKSRTSFTFND